MVSRLSPSSSTSRCKSFDGKTKLPVGVEFGLMESRVSDEKVR